jgi:hypothetical protein
MEKNTKRTAKRKEPTAHAQAVAVMDFMNSNAPEFIRCAVVDAIDRACEHLDPHRPFKLYYEKGSERNDMDVLMAVCKRTKLLSLSAMEHTEAGLARHVIAIVNHPKVPNALYNKVADFVTSATNIQDSTGETLLDRWAYAPETVTALLTWAKEADEKEEIA